MWLQIPKIIFDKYGARKRSKYLKGHFKALHHFHPLTRGLLGISQVGTTPGVPLLLGRANSQKLCVEKLMKFGLTAANRLKFFLQRQALHKHSPLLPSEGAIWTPPRSSFLKAGPLCPWAENRTGYQVPGTAAGLGHRRPSTPTSGSSPKPGGTTESPRAAQEKGDFRRCRFLGPDPAPLNTVSTDGTQQAECWEVSPRS